MAVDNSSLVGRAFGELTVKAFEYYTIEKTNTRRYWWLCECSCGKRLVVRRDLLIAGIKKHCGCLRKKREDIS